MSLEQHYDFRRELNEVHKRDRRDLKAVPAKNEVVIDDSWCIVLPPDAGRVVDCAAEDLQDYFRVSMGIYLPLVRETSRSKAIVLSVKADKKKKRSYKFEVASDKVLITGTDPEGTGQGCYFIEDLMNLRSAPFLEKQKIFREPVFSPRMTHSGWGLDQFPDSHLNAIAHAGFDSVLLFVKAPNLTTHGFMDFNDLIDRCEKYGLGVYFYSYLPSFKSPDDPDADEFFEASYGAVFKESPRARGLILVGESCSFPSKDPRTNGKKWGSPRTGIADGRPSPGGFPCSDYPDWLNAVRKAVHKYSPDADIVFWTYNWGRAPAKARIDLINALPSDVSLEVTFEMFELIKKYPNHQMVQPDYSITFPGPGFYFTSEAEAARKRNLRLYTMANSAGRTWDFGVAPYVPAPFQWLKRFDAMLEAHEKWNLSGVMDSHHYGWFPSEICECAKWCFWKPAADGKKMLEKIAERDFGKKAAKEVIQAWKLWSSAMDSYTPGYDDQSGPLRVGPSYPFIFHPVLYPHTEQNMVFPTYPQSPVGAGWVRTMYCPEHVYQMTNCGRRFPEDIRIMGNALKIWEKGNAIMRKALAKVPQEKKEKAEKAAGVGFFCCNTIRTMIHTKRWWLLNKKLEVEYDFGKAGKLLDEMNEVLEEEEKNVRDTIPLVEKDSRLGWEASMDYMCDKWHLEWKLAQIGNLMENTLPTYRSSLSLTPRIYEEAEARRLAKAKKTKSNGKK
ncbi:MAG: hypothetical protein J6A21_04500 [Lentisphaeria bacterium]|nr:hypothetical protein [Lentisphaeria bacterium]